MVEGQPAWRDIVISTSNRYTILIKIITITLAYSHNFGTFKVSPLLHSHVSLAYTSQKHLPPHPPTNLEGVAVLAPSVSKLLTNSSTQELG